MADDLDILTFEEGQTAINMSSSNAGHDEELAAQITAISRIIDSECGPVVEREVIEIHGGTGTVFLREWPVVEVTTLRSAYGGTITTLDLVEFGGTGDGYYLDPTMGKVTRADGGCFYGQVQAVYTAGRFADTESVDPRFKVCAQSILRRLWKREAGTWAQASTFFEDSDPGTTGLGFFRVAKPIIDEMLADQVRPPGIA